MDIHSDGGVTLITKVGGGAGGYPPGKLVDSKSRPLTKQETQALIARVNASGFYELPSYDRSKAGNDGAEWVLEAADQGKYRLVSQWTPKDGPIHDLGFFFIFELARLKIPKSEIY